MLPSQSELEQVAERIISIPNRQKESKRKIHYGLFLLGYKSGLRVNEAVSFDLASKNKQGLYRIEKPKGKKERFVYIPKKVIGELKKQNWKPNQTNRWNFYHFLRKIKREMNVSKEIELTPHTLRHAFTTYQAENGLPLPLLQKLLGHSSIRTTALYWRNVYRADDNDIGGILAGKRWLEEKEPPTPKLPSRGNFAPPKVDTFPKPPKNSKPIFIDQKPVIPNKEPNSPPLIEIETKTQAKPNFYEMTTGDQSVNNKPALNTSEKPRIYSEISQKEPANQKEQILLAKIRNLEERLSKTETERDNLRIEKEKAEAISQQEKELSAKQKQRADNNYARQLKSITKILYQIQKNNYYQQLEQEQKELEAKIIQTPPLKVK